MTGSLPGHLDIGAFLLIGGVILGCWLHGRWVAWRAQYNAPFFVEDVKPDWWMWEEKTLYEIRGLPEVQR